MKSLTVDDVLGPKGKLARVLPNYEAREEQLAMARAVNQAFEESHYLVVEAGTGTGKTLAYLVPALLSGTQVIVSTATKTLQEQLYFRDLPLLRERLGFSFRAAYLKGRQNYLCLYKLSNFEREGRFLNEADRKSWPQVQEWLSRTQTGDRAELEIGEGFTSWNQLSVYSEACLGTTCPFYESCFVTQARKRAETADVVVVNHHLYFADLVVRHASGRKKEGVLPSRNAVIFDEAHALESVATDFFGVQVSSYRLDDLVDDAIDALDASDPRAGMISAVALQIRSHAQKFFHAAGKALGFHSENSVRLNAGSLDATGFEIATLLGSLSEFAARIATDVEPVLNALWRRTSEIKAELEFIVRAESDSHVFWAEQRGRHVFLRAAPIDIAEEFRKRLQPNIETAIFTSATLRTDGAFGYYLRRLGLTDSENVSVKTLAVASPFDYANQAALYLPKHLPDPHEPLFVPSIVEEILELTSMTQGRAFALFTSLRNMRAAYELARLRLPFQILVQGELPKTQLLERFQSAPSVLFASQSFWEGVDVPGEALSLVIIDKLPFASPSEPLVAARIERMNARGEDAFSSYQLPEAAIALRQGFGRLIRTREDRGIVAILDKRIVTRRYGRTFLRTLPTTPRFSDRKALALWWKMEAVNSVVKCHDK